jgi:predicted nucleic-acid-binding Zn-ribbon protein
MNNELKPCPFCGGKPYITKDEDFFEIGCSNPKYKITSVYVNGKDEKKTTAVWNKRVTERMKANNPE